MTRIISIISGKGGVGKTTAVSNIGAALVKRGKDVIILDGNITTPNLSLHLGIPFYPVTLHDVLEKKIPVEAAIYTHPSGLKIVPASLAADHVRKADIGRLEGILWNMMGKADLIIVDAAAGLGKEALAAIDVADELIIITNPNLPAVTDALKTIKLAEDNGTKILGVIVNRVRGLKHELKLSEIRSMLGVPILAVVPEDLAVPKSIARRTPVVHFRPRSRASREFNRLAAKIIGEGWKVRKKRGWFERLFSWLS